MEALEVLGISGGMTAVAVLILGYVLKRFFDDALDREMQKEKDRRDEVEAQRERTHDERQERLRAELAKDTLAQLAGAQAAHARDLEQLRSELAVQRDLAAAAANADLRVQAFQRETRFAALHARQAEAYVELHERIERVQRSLENLVDILRFDGPDPAAQAEGERRRREAFIDAWAKLSDCRARNCLLFDTAVGQLLEEYCRSVLKVANKWDCSRDPDEGAPDVLTWQAAFTASRDLRKTLLLRLSRHMQKSFGLEDQPPLELAGGGNQALGGDDQAGAE